MQHHNYDMIVMVNIIADITIMIAMIIMIMMIAATADYHQDIAIVHQDFNDFSMRGSFRFVNTLCTDSTVVR